MTKTTERSVQDRVVTLIEEEMGVEREKITRAAELAQDLGCDSLDTVEIVMGLEEEFGIEIPDEDCDRLRTVGDLIAYVERRQAE